MLLFIDDKISIFASLLCNKRVNDTVIYYLISFIIRSSFIIYYFHFIFLIL